MSASWINTYVTVAPLAGNTSVYYGELGPSDIIADEVARRLRATNAPWGSANKLISWFQTVDRIQRVDLLDRGDFRVLPVLLVALFTGIHDEVPGKVDVNTVRVNLAVVADATTLTGTIGNGQASVATIFDYLKRFLSVAPNRQLTVTIDSKTFPLAPRNSTVFGPITYVPDLRPAGQGEASSLSAWSMPVDYGVSVDIDTGRITNVKANDP